jgi:hypothetical protein
VNSRARYVVYGCYGGVLLIAVAGALGSRAWRRGPGKEAAT